MNDDKNKTPANLSGYNNADRKKNNNNCFNSRTRLELTQTCEPIVNDEEGDDENEIQDNDDVITKLIKATRGHLYE